MQEISKTYLEESPHILPRRYGIKPQSFLYGAPSVGKSALALLYSRAYKNTLYINCADCRTDIASAHNFITNHSVLNTFDCLIIDNYTPHLRLPSIENMLLLAQSPTDCPEGFQTKHIRALSFEEYVSFDNKNQSIDHLFKSFLKDGNLAQMITLPTYLKIPRKQEILKLALKNDFMLFAALLPLQAQKLSPHHIYTLLKKSHKVSKDRIYPLLHIWQECGIIYLLPHLMASHKKLYFYDFTLPLCVSNSKNLQAMLENMLFLELLAFCERYGVSTDIHYGDMGEFICALGVFIFLPFANEENIPPKLAKLKAPYKHIYVITFDFEGRGSIREKSLEWEAMSFIDFALEFSPKNGFLELTHFCHKRS